MLALNGVLGAKRRSRTLIFDEVDAGIGGKVAAVVGEKLRALAASHQVIVITHLPQIASLADTHFAVEKRIERGRTVAQARELDREGRIAELARMMGGKTVTPLDLRHAEELLRKSGGRAERRSS
jgi:DNA repair protein RecN (Recombination protein N)